MRHDLPERGRDEVVPSVLIGIRRIRHFVFDTPQGWLIACNGTRVPSEDIWPVRARDITCKRCRSKYLNV